MIRYTTNAQLDPKDLAELFDASGIKRPTADLPRLTKMIENANLTITVWDENRLVGAARSLTDFSYCCYLSDLAVHKEYQHRGIGRELIARTREIIGEGCSLILLAAPQAMDYYPKVGFEKIENGWIVKRGG
jgi:ribosomal protein S18 acetylase RimI-like enzyme